MYSEHRSKLPKYHRTAYIYIYIYMFFIIASLPVCAQPVDPEGCCPQAGLAPVLGCQRGCSAAAPGRSPPSCPASHRECKPDPRRGGRVSVPPRAPGQRVGSRSPAAALGLGKNAPRRAAATLSLLPAGQSLWVAPHPGGLRHGAAAASVAGMGLAGGLAAQPAGPGVGREGRSPGLARALAGLARCSQPPHLRRALGRVPRLWAHPAGGLGRSGG